MRVSLIAVVVTGAMMAVPVFTQRALSASKGWLHAPASGDSGVAAFITIENPGMYDVYVVSASSDAAGSVQLRAPAANGGPPATIKDAVVPAYDSLEMTLKGPHLWLTELKRPLKAGDSITLVVMTDGGVALEVTAAVRDR